MFDADIMRWVIIPIVIFLVRIADVSFGTLRFVFITKNLKLWATVAAFFEVLIWITVVKEVILHVDHIVSLLAYSAGYAAGNFVGLYIIERLSIGKVVIRIITRQDCSPLLAAMEAQRYRVMAIEPSEESGKINIIYAVAGSERTHDVISLVKEYNPNAFYTIEDVKHVSEEMVPLKRLDIFRLLKRRGK